MRFFLLACFLWTAAARVPQAEAGISLFGRRALVNKGSSDLQQQMRAIAIAPVTIGLIVTSLVCILCITLLLIKWRQNSKKIDKLYSRVRGLNHSLLLDQMKTSKDRDERDALQAMLSKEQALMADTERDLQITSEKLEASTRELKADRALIATQKAEIKFLKAEDKALINDINRRNKVFVDLEKQIFRFVEPIEFVGEYVTPDMEEAPPAQYRNPQLARETISDLAKILGYVTKVILLVEGHTSGGQEAMSHIGFQIACERAEKVVETLVELGVDPKRLEAKGRPGLLGENKPEVKLVTLSWGV